MAKNQINPINKSEKKTSKLAIVSFVAVIVVVVYFFIGGYEDIFVVRNLFLVNIPLFLGLIAIILIERNRDKLKGKWLAYISLLIPILFWSFFIILCSFLP